MGIFDEAIREHLELKRQHGAGDSELRNLEDAAFGPPARPGEPAVAEEPVALGSEAPTELAALQEVPELAEPSSSSEAEVAEGDVDDEVPELEEPPPAPGGDPVALETEEHPPPEGATEPPEPPASVGEQPTELYEPEDAGLPIEEPGAPAGSDVLEDEFFSEQSLSDELDQALDAPEGEELPTAEPAPDVDEPLPPAEPEGEVAEEGEEGEEGEDVLEETPEFLQDTPESDRLWFEQRPPKDFDFDD
jgi:hypothetical protein